MPLGADGLRTHARNGSRSDVTVVDVARPARPGPDALTPRRVSEARPRVPSAWPRLSKALTNGKAPAGLWLVRSGEGASRSTQACDTTGEVRFYRDHVLGAEDLEAGGEGIGGEVVSALTRREEEGSGQRAARPVQVAGVAWSCREGQRFAR